VVLINFNDCRVCWVAQAYMLISNSKDANEGVRLSMIVGLVGAWNL
jgi:uncharacterized membrane protein YeaQ/YmgE (transglycosylase-associated protein family)